MTDHAAIRRVSGHDRQGFYCSECGSRLSDAGEYHPWAFCVLVRAGLDPWEQVRMIAGQLGLGDPGKTPPKVVETHG